MKHYQLNRNAIRGLSNSALCFVIAIAMSCAVAAIELTPAQRAQIKTAIETMQKQMAIKGVSAAVITANEAFTAVAGESFAGRPITADMVFGIGSVTKTLTSTTLMQMQEKGLVSLDDAIGKWIPSNPNIDASITVRQLLGHRSGLADYSMAQEYRSAVLANANRVFKPEELFPFIKEPLAKRGETFNYCNTNYLLAGMIITRITGKSIGNVYREYIFSGLQLDSTYMGVEDSLPIEVAVRWLGTQSGQNASINAAFSGAWTAGAVFSNAREIATFMRELHRGAIASQASLAEMHTYLDTVTYGLGVSRQILSGNVVLGHTGSIRGYESIVLYVPSIDVGLAVLVNQGPSEPVMIAARLVDILTQELSVANEHAGNTLRIMPNPASAHVSVSGLSGVDHISVVDATGCEQLMITVQSAGEMTFDTSTLAPGAYVLVARGPAVCGTVPLVISR